MKLATSRRKLFFITDGKTFPDKQKLKEFMTNRLALQKCLKEFLKLKRRNTNKINSYKRIKKLIKT